MSQRQYIHVQCPVCGSDMQYTGGKQKLSCTKCKYSRSLGRSRDQVDFRPLQEGISFRDFERGLGEGLQAHHCTNCTSMLVISASAERLPCPFCRGEAWEESQQIGKVLTPMQMLPFHVPRTRAASKLKKYLRGWFLAPGLRKVAEAPTLRGVYLPVLLVDAMTRSTWVGQAGFNYVEKSNKGPVQKVAYEPTTGYYENFFDAVPIFATKGTQVDRLSYILPFDYRNLIDYDPALLEEWEVELYQQPEIKLIEIANVVTDKEIEASVQTRIRGQNPRKVKVVSEKFTLAVRHVLVPVWVASYTYQGQRFQFLINGQNGKLAGPKPLSTPRILATIGAGILLLLGLAWWAGS